MHTTTDRILQEIDERVNSHLAAILNRGKELADEPQHVTAVEPANKMGNSTSATSGTKSLLSDLSMPTRPTHRTTRGKQMPPSINPKAKSIKAKHDPSTLGPNTGKEQLQGSKQRAQPPIAASSRRMLLEVQTPILRRNQDVVLLKEKVSAIECVLASTGLTRRQITAERSATAVIDSWKEFISIGTQNREPTTAELYALAYPFPLRGLRGFQEVGRALLPVLRATSPQSLALETTLCISTLRELFSK